MGSMILRSCLLAKHALIAFTFIIALSSVDAQAASCHYENWVGDKLYAGSLSLQIDWSSKDTGRPTDGEEICPTTSTGTGFNQRTAMCPKAGQQLYSFSAKTLHGKSSPDLLAFYGFVWFKTCD
jgi:hypothetical protein